MAPPAHIAAPPSSSNGPGARTRDGVLDVGAHDDGRPVERRRAFEPVDDEARDAPRPRRTRRARFEDDFDDEPPPPRSSEPGPMPVVYEQVLDATRVDADAARVIRRLREAGFDAYLVGGGVRDLLLGRTPKDFDVATDARPQDVRRVFRNCRIIGRRFRLAHILFPDNKVIECATFRRDPEQELAELAPDVSADRPHRAEGAVRLVPLRGVGDDDDLLIRHDNHFGLPHEDAARRDFTVNGLFYDPRRNSVIDYVGGMADLDRRIVRTIGDPVVRFREDPIRILRAIKFSARLDMGLSSEVYDAIVDERGELSRAAKPRLYEEILRLLRGGAAMRSMYLTWDLGVLSVVLPELSAFFDDGERAATRTFQRLSALDARTRAGDVPSDTVLLFALFRDALDEAFDGEADLLDAFSSAFPDLEAAVAFPRKAKERIASLYVALERLRRGRVTAVQASGLFEEARLLYVVEHEVEGRKPPDWALGLAEVPDEEPGPKKKRRRRKKKP